jgi:Delta7-sterol 5-desaturase
MTITEFLQVWPIIFTIDFARYVLTAGLMALLLVALAKRLAGRRIRVAGAPAGQVRSEILASMRTVLIFSLVGFTIHLGASHGVLRVYPSIADFGWTYFAASVLLSIVAQDAYFYWTHRAMHHPALFRLFHRRHHRSVAPTPWTAYSFDAPEAFVQAVFLPLFLLVVPMHPAAIFLFVTHMIVRNVVGHCGYELFPRSLADNRWLGWSNSVTHHDLHHETFRSNYGLYFTWWDRLMGTEHPEYRRRLRGAGAAVLLCLSLQMQNAEAIEGEWATQGFSARVRIAECAEGLCGRIVWLWDPAHGALAGTEILRGFRRGANGEWTGGTIYNPEDGRTYSATLSIGSAGELRLRGCALSIFCQTQVWRRASAVCGP